MQICPSTTATVQTRTGSKQGGAVGAPVRRSNRPWWNGHSISQPITVPSDRKPGPCVQASAVT